MQVTVRAHSCKIDVRVLGGMQSAEGAVLRWCLGCCLRCWWHICEIDGALTGVAFCEIDGWCRCCFGGPGATVQSLACVSLSGVYAGVIYF